MSDTAIGAIIALSSVVLTLISGHVADWIKTSAALKESQRQRELALKRELYLPLIQAFTEGVNLFIAIPQAHHSKLADLKLSLSAQNALASKDLIANEKVIAAVGAVTKRFEIGLLSLMLTKMDEAMLAIDGDSLNKRINDLMSENRLIIDRMRTLQDAATLQPEVAQALDLQLKTNYDEQRKLFKEQHELLIKHNDIIKKLQEQSMKEVVAMTAFIPTAVIEIRRDLQLPINAEAIHGYYKETLQSMNEVIPGYIDEIWAKVEAGMEKGKDYDKGA